MGHSLALRLSRVENFIRALRDPSGMLVRKLDIIFLQLSSNACRSGPKSRRMASARPARRLQCTSPPSKVAACSHARHWDAQTRRGNGYSLLCSGRSKARTLLPGCAPQTKISCSAASSCGLSFSHEPEFVFNMKPIVLATSAP